LMFTDLLDFERYLNNTLFTAKKNSKPVMFLTSGSVIKIIKDKKWTEFRHVSV